MVKSALTKSAILLLASSLALAGCGEPQTKKAPAEVHFNAKVLQETAFCTNYFDLDRYIRLVRFGQTELASEMSCSMLPVGLEMVALFTDAYDRDKFRIYSKDQILEGWAKTRFISRSIHHVDDTK